MNDAMNEAAANAVILAKGSPQSVPMQTPAGPAAVAIHPAQMIQALMDKPDIDLEKVEKLFELQERYEANEAKKAYFDAVARFQAEVPVIGQDQNVTYGSGQNRTSFDFTSLPKIIKTARPLLAKHGLTLTWRTGTTEKGDPIVTAILTHELGYGEDTTMAAPADTSGGKNPIQGLRSAWSYLRRLTAESILGIATSYEDDDDGDTVEGKPAEVEVVLPPMPDDVFSGALKSAVERLKTPEKCEAFISKLSTKYTLSDIQLKSVRAQAEEIPF